MKIEDLKASDIMEKNYFSVSSEDRVKEVLNKIRGENIFAMPVIDDGEVEGMITWRNIIKRSSPPNTKVKKLISYPPRVEHDTGIVDLAEILLESGDRAVPVYREKELVGIITQREIIRAVSKDKSFGNIKAGEISTDPVTIGKEGTIGQAKAKMRENRIARLPVVDEDGTMIGSVDLSGLVKTFHPDKAMKVGERKGDSLPERDSPVTGIMNKNPLSLPHDTDVRELARKIDKEGGLYAVLVKDNVPVGIITPKDITEMIASKKEREGAYIQIAGVKDLDSFTKDKILDAAERKVEKAGKMFRDVQRLILHVKRQNTNGGEEQYSTRARMFTSGGLFAAKQDWEWDILESVHGCLSKLDKQITKHHEKKIERRRGKK